MSRNEPPATLRTIEPRHRDLGGFSVERLLPAPFQRAVGPFVFFDHIGPTVLGAGAGFDVRPHPHIGLATITYLFEGSFVHKDSLGSDQIIRPGDVNWMIAGRGIAHSERTGPEERRQSGPLHGIQTWVALPRDQEEIPPRFEHHPAPTLPRLKRDGVQLTVIAGTAYGLESPTSVLSPTLYVHALIEPGATLPIDETHEERALFLISGQASLESHPLTPQEMVVLKPGSPASVQAQAPTSLILVGGAPLDGPRHIWWNFVSSSRERIERAKEDWKNGVFEKIPGDEVEFIPLPQG